MRRFFGRLLSRRTGIAATIRNLKSQLSSIIEPDFGLLDQLLSLKVLTSRHYDDIRHERGAAYRRSEAVLDLLETDDQCNRFLIALQRTGQQHIFNYIKANGGQTINLSVNYPTIFVVSAYIAYLLSALSAIARPSVCLSVRQTGVSYENG